ncbi:polysaccharide biosynthesis C-terminal domain-containing protein [Sinobaca sp. H24]|uniref:polysaccharide biosynthesis C-terminal domain-containing protein n=1 Tax=Sinobaca sp. H24 TaxID=2923376 RepID=UPI0035B023FF
MVLVPLLQEERMKGKLASSRYYASLMMKVSFLLGMAAAAGMVILTEPINIMLFTNDSGTGVLRTLSTALVMSGTVMISAAVLQGNGSFRVPAVSLAAGFAVKLICNIVLIPVLDTHGAAIGTVAGLSVTAAVNIYWIYRKDMMEAFTIVWLGKALAALAGMSILLLVMMTAGEDLMHDENRLVAAGFTLMTCAAGGILFLYLTAVLQVITKEEQNMLPGVKKLQSLRKRRNK